MRAAILTVSTSKARGEGEDTSGARLAEFAGELGLEVAAREVVPDERGTIEARLAYFCDELGVELVLTSGGTGLAPDDVTPEATRAVLDREAPGIAEAMRAASRPHTAHWMLSRGVAGTRGSTLVVNFPGSPRSIGQCGEAIAASLPHALALLAGERPTHGAWRRARGDGYRPDMAEMTRREWLRAFCAEIGVDAPTAEEEAALLELAATAAHDSERPAAPLACWAAGRTGRSPDELRQIARGINPASGH